MHKNDNDNGTPGKRHITYIINIYKPASHLYVLRSLQSMHAVPNDTTGLYVLTRSRLHVQNFRELDLDTCTLHRQRIVSLTVT